MSQCESVSESVSEVVTISQCVILGISGSLYVFQLATMSQLVKQSELVSVCVSEPAEQ